MEGSPEFFDQLVAALDGRANWLAATVIPQLKETLTSFEANFESVMGLLIRKGLLREDPYKYDQDFTDIVVPGDEPLPEFESADELSYRLSAFRRQVKLLTSQYSLDLGSLGLARLKKLSALIFYVNWLDFGEGGKSNTTKAFARVFMQVRMGADTIASKVLKDGEIQIVRVQQQLRGILADLIAYNRESWKAELRRVALPHPSAGDRPGKRDELLRVMRRNFAQAASSQPWYNALAEEVADEELAPDGAERKARLLASLAILETDKPPAGAPGQNDRETLLEAVRMLSRPHEEIATALAVLEENEKLLTETKARGGWLRRLFGTRKSRSPVDRIYKVQYVEAGASAPKTEPVDFAAFARETAKKASLFSVLSSGSGPAFRRLEATGDEQLAGFVDRQLNDLLLIHRRMEGLNMVFQARAMQDRKTARGIKVELLTIKNSIVKANKRRHEYKDAAN